MTNNPLKISGLDHYGIEVTGRDPIEMTCNEKNRMYLYTKYRKMGHLLHFSQNGNFQGQDSPDQDTKPE